MISRQVTGVERGFNIGTNRKSYYLNMIDGHCRRVWPIYCIHVHVLGCLHNYVNVLNDSLKAVLFLPLNQASSLYIWTPPVGLSKSM